MMRGYIMNKRTDNLRSLTMKIHHKSERHEIAEQMLKGDIDPETYAVYLWNLYQIYVVLENAALSLDLINQDTIRSSNLMFDFQELWDKDFPPPTCKTTIKHKDRIIENISDPTVIMAHVYVRHMGELHGGQILKNQVPGSGKFYEFDDAKTAIAEIVSKLDDSMYDEAVAVFKLSNELLDEVLEYQQQNNLGGE